MHFRCAIAGIGIRKRESTMRTGRRGSMDTLDTARALHNHKTFFKDKRIISQNELSGIMDSSCSPSQASRTSDASEQIALPVPQ